MCSMIIPQHRQLEYDPANPIQKPDQYKPKLYKVDYQARLTPILGDSTAGTADSDTTTTTTSTMCSLPSLHYWDEKQQSAGLPLPVTASNGEEKWIPGNENKKWAVCLMACLGYGALLHRIWSH